MNTIKNILGRLFALWTMLVFIVLLVIFYIPLWATRFFSEPKNDKYFYAVVRVWLGLFFIFTGVRRIIKGRENFKKGENYVVVCNHTSLMDPPLSSTVIPGIFRTIAKNEMAKIPVFGMVYKRGSVLVDRKNDKSRKESYIKMKNVLNKGMHMCIYPEGTRNKSSEPLQRFQDGAFKLAKDSGKSIIPSVIFHTNTVLPGDKKFFYWPHRVEMHFLPPVPVSDDSTAESLKETVFNQMKEYYVANYS
jgi:1-acyl-sn-glycerol-3-phosphate acyltransferase